MADHVYDGFISYSHAADGLLAPRLQTALQRFAKPWWKRRAVRVFRDESSLSANPHLWSSITEALDQSAWFVLLLSPDAARSEWVNQEIEYWTEHKDPTRILPVVTDGEFGWDGDVTGTATPPALQGVFTEEPRWVDLRFARDEDQLDLKNPRFSSAVADIASALRGVPKDELESEEVKQHRRTIRTAWGGVALVGVLAVVATVFGIQSANNAAEAERQAEIASQNEATALAEADRADANAEAEAEARMESERQAQLALARELGASAVNVLEDDPELAILLTLEAMGQTPDGIDQPVEVINALWEAVQGDRLVSVIDTGSAGGVWIDLSEDGSLLAVSSANDSTLRFYSVPDGSEQWAYTEETTDRFGLPFVSPDGKMVAVGIWDSTSRLALTGLPPDDLPARVVILDADDGTVIETLDYPDCVGVRTYGWSPGGSYFAVSHVVDPCPRPGVSNDSWVEILDGRTFVQVALVDAIAAEGPVSRFDQSENLYVFGADRRGLEIYPAPEFRLERIVENITSVGDISHDGTLAVTIDLGGTSGLAVYDVATGQRLDRLRPSPDFARTPITPRFSPDGSRVIMATAGTDTVIWDVGTAEKVFSLGGGPGTNASAGPDGDWLYTAHSDGTVKVWDLRPAGGLGSVDDLGTYGWINANTFAIGPELGAASAFDLGAFDPRMVFFDTTTGAFVGEPVAAWAPLPAVPLADNRFVLRTLAGEWIVYDPMTGTQRYLAGCPSDLSGQVCTDTEDPVPEIEYLASLDGTELAVSIDGSPNTRIDPDTGEELGELAPGLYAEGSFFTDDWATARTEDNALVVIDRATGEELWRNQNPDIARAEASAAGDVIAFWSPVRTTILHTDTWEAQSIALDLGEVRGLSVSPDGTKVALGDENGLHIIDVASVQLEQSIPLPSVSDIHWLDEDTVLIAGTNGIWASIPLSRDELITLAKDNLTRGFSAEECTTYRIDPCPTLEEMRDG